MAGVTADGRTVLEALEQLPAGRAILRAAASLPGVHLVGGAVRDLLRGGVPRELDVVVEADPAPLIELLGGDRGGSPPDIVRHERFGTASIVVDGGQIDIARSRRERYPQPAALPEVEPAPLAEDLLRRDFTVNAIAVSLPDGRLAAAPLALEDLAAGRLRVLHDESFRDDPTRLLRMARLGVRLGFTLDEHTAALAAAADLGGLSGARIAAELRLAMSEDDPVGVLAAFAEIPGLPLDVDRQVIGRARELLGAAGRDDLLLLAAVTRRSADPGWLGGLELTAHERDVVVAAWEAGPLARSIAASSTPSELHTLLSRQPVEAVALAGGLGPAAVAGRWLGELRHVSLEIDGADLIAAGIAPGPEIGQRLARTLALKLDGSLVGGRQGELETALSDPAGDADGEVVGGSGGAGGAEREILRGPRAAAGHRRIQDPDRRSARRLLG